LITRADKALWDRVRETYGAPEAKGRTQNPDGDTANLIAAVLDGVASDADRRAFQKRVKRDPALLEAFLAARAAREAGPVEAPQTLRALARHVYSPPSRGRAGGRLGGGLSVPRWGWIAASVIAVMLAVGGYYLGQETAGPVADNGTAGSATTIANDIDLDGSNQETSSGLFDALDLDF
jgi:hypothetical protein